MSKYLKIFLFSLMVFMGCEDAVDGEDGLPIMVIVVDEPTGDNCANGGSKVSFGYDNNSNGMLDVTEVTTSTYICNGVDGLDGSANVDVQIVQWTSSMTNFYEHDEPNNGDGAIYAVFTNEGITAEMVADGIILVESARDPEGPWIHLPYMTYSGDDSDVNYIFDSWYHYSEGVLRIDWNCSFGMTLTEWEANSSEYEIYYKITIIAE